MPKGNRPFARSGHMVISNNSFNNFIIPTARNLLIYDLTRFSRYKFTYAGEQVTQWDFQNKGRSRWTGTSYLVLEVPLCNLLTSMCDFLPCDQIVQRAY